MLEQLQSGAASGTLSAAEKKGGKNGKTGIFANLFSALAHKKGQVAKAISTGNVEKNKTHQNVNTLQALLKPATVNKTAKGRNGQKLLNTEHPASGKKTAHIQATRLESGNLLSTDPKQKESMKKKTDKQANTDATLAAIVQPFGKPEAVKMINTTADVKNSFRNQAKEKLPGNSGTVLTNASETKSNVQSSVQDTKQTGINGAPINNRDTTNGSASASDKVSFQTLLAADSKPAGQTSTAHVREAIAQQTNQTNLTPQNDKAMKELIASDNKNRLDAQASLAQQSSLATQKNASIAKPEYNQPNSASPSSANASTGHAPVLTLLNQNNGQSNFAQNGFAQNGQNSGGQLTGGANNIPVSDQTAGQDTADSRFASVLQSENRSTQGYEVNQQLPARPSHPLKAMQAMQRIAMSAKGGVTRLELQLEPAHLGKINVSLQTDAAKQLQVHLTVEHAISRQIIEQHIPQLRAALEQQGLSLDQFSLQTGSQQQHTAQHDSSEWANDRRQQQSGELSASAPSDTPINMQTATHGRLSIHI